jgi:hypothetical protein
MKLEFGPNTQVSLQSTWEWIVAVFVLLLALALVARLAFVAMRKKIPIRISILWFKVELWPQPIPSTTPRKHKG